MLKINVKPNSNENHNEKKMQLFEVDETVLECLHK